MNALVVILRYLYRIRYWLLIGPLLVTGLVYYFSKGMSTTFEANTTIFTGIISTPDISSETSSKSNPSNAYDNIIYLVHSSTIVEKVSLRLLARVLVNGSAEKDNKFIDAENFKKVRALIPEDVKSLIVKGNEEATFKNLQKYKTEDKDNFIYGLLNWSHPYFSVSALDKIVVGRLGNSDMIELKYTCDDPGIVFQTLNIVNEELINQYSFFQLGSSNSVTTYFQNQLDSVRSLLRVQEDSLVLFSKEQNIVDYTMQTQMMVQRLESYKTLLDAASMDASTSQEIINHLEKRLAKRAEILKNNQAFLQSLGTVSLFSKKIASIMLESRESGDAGGDVGESGDADKLPVYRQALQKSERQLYALADNVNATLYTTDGVALNDLVNEWLSETLKHEKSKAEMVILEQKKKIMESDYFQYAPVGPELKRQEREITLTEETYHALMNRLSEAKMQQKSFEVKSAQLNIVTLPVYPLSFIESKRKSLIMLAFAGSLIFILSCFLVIELMDRTIRDKYRIFALTKEVALGAFPGPLLLKYRSHAKEIERIVSSYVANRLMYLVEPGKMNLINLISKESGEGHSTVAASLADHWNAQGFDVRVVSHRGDYDVNHKDYYEATSVEQLIRLGSNKPDFVIMEHAPLDQNSINKNLLKQAVVNIYLIRATRAWTEVDNLMLHDISNQGRNVFILLTHAKIFAVEDFTGLLPPVSNLRKWANRLLKLELTSEKETKLE